MESIYKLQKVRKHRQKGDTIFELRIPELGITAGEFCAVIGESGCGKSTFLDILALVLEPTDVGTFRLYDIADNCEHQIQYTTDTVLAKLRRKYLGYILQSGGLLPFLTVEENIRLTMQLNNRPDEPWFEEIVTRLKLRDQLTKKPAHLSGGQRQRVAIGRAVAHRPPIILADEPTAAVDFETAIEIRNMLVDIAEESNTAIIMVTHDRNLVADTATSFITFDLSKSDDHNETISVASKTTSIGEAK